MWEKQLGTETSAGFTAFQYKMFNIWHLNTGFRFSFIDHREYKQHMDYCVTWDLNIKCFQIFFHLDNWIFKILLCIKKTLFYYMNPISQPLTCLHMYTKLKDLLYWMSCMCFCVCMHVWQTWGNKRKTLIDIHSLSHTFVNIYILRLNLVSYRKP